MLFRGLSFQKIRHQENRITLLLVVALKLRAVGSEQPQMGVPWGNAFEFRVRSG